MPSNRFFIDAALDKGTEVTIEDPQELQHLRVMRTREGEHIELVNGRNVLATGVVLSLEKRSAQVAVKTVETREATASPITLAIPFTQGSKLDWIVEKGCELGAAAIFLYPAELSEKRSLSDNHLRRFRHLLISAMKQCGRLDLPQLEVKPPLCSWEPFVGRTLFGDTRPEAPPISRNEEATLFITGPEQGFSSEETKVLSSRLGAHGVRLHRNILRMETAPLVALAVLSGV